MQGTFNTLTLSLKVSCLESHRYLLRIQVPTILQGTSGPEHPIFESENNILVTFLS